MANKMTMLLTDAPLGETYQLVSLKGGKGLQRRLAEMGLTPGINLRVLQDAGGPLLIAIRSSRIALGRGMAKKITVAPLKEDN
ncbi:MAG: FeoA family protein [Chloroflexota bacterium]